MGKYGSSVPENSFCFNGREGEKPEQRNNYLCTYALYSPVHNVLDACISIMRESGRGLGPGIQEFFGPCEMATS
jgi:hypothetical protein